MGHEKPVNQENVHTHIRKRKTRINTKFVSVLLYIQIRLSKVGQITITLCAAVRFFPRRPRRHQPCEYSISKCWGNTQVTQTVVCVVRTHERLKANGHHFELSRINLKMSESICYYNSYASFFSLVCAYIIFAKSVVHWILGPCMPWHVPEQRAAGSTSLLHQVGCKWVGQPGANTGFESRQQAQQGFRCHFWKSASYSNN